MSKKDLSLSKLLEDAARVSMADVWVSMPARVEKYDPDRQTITAQPLLRGRKKNDDDEYEAERIPPVTSVPVIFNGTRAGGLSFPVEVGDEVLLVFVSGGLERWISSGEESDAVDDRRNYISDAFAILGVLSPARVGDAPGTPVSTSATVLRGDDVRIGSKDADKRVLIEEALTRFKAALDSALSTAIIGLGAGGASSITAALNTALASGGIWPDVAGKVMVE